MCFYRAWGWTIFLFPARLFVWLTLRLSMSQTACLTSESFGQAVWAYNSAADVWFVRGGVLDKRGKRYGFVPGRTAANVGRAAESERIWATSAEERTICHGPRLVLFPGFWKFFRGNSFRSAVGPEGSELAEKNSPTPATWIFFIHG